MKSCPFLRRTDSGYGDLLPVLQAPTANVGHHGTSPAFGSTDNDGTNQGSGECVPDPITKKQALWVVGILVVMVLLALAGAIGTDSSSLSTSELRVRTGGTMSNYLRLPTRDGHITTCAGPGSPCSRCNPDDPPRMPDGWQSLIDRSKPSDLP